MLGPLPPELVLQVVRERPRQARGGDLVEAWEEVHAREQQSREKERTAVALRIRRGRLAAAVVGEGFVAGAGGEQGSHPQEMHVVPHRARQLAEREQVERRQRHRDERVPGLEADRGAQRREDAHRLHRGRRSGRDGDVRDEPPEPLRRDAQRRRARGDLRRVPRLGADEDHGRNDDSQRRELHGRLREEEPPPRRAHARVIPAEALARTHAQRADTLRHTPLRRACQRRRRWMLSAPRSTSRARARPASPPATG
jgi:hypothetical protein